MPEPTESEFNFADFVEAVAAAKENDAGVMLQPDRLGDTYEEVMASLRHLAEQRVPLMLVKDIDKEADPCGDCPTCRAQRN
jgi:hypothetical protein